MTLIRWDNLLNPGDKNSGTLFDTFEPFVFAKRYILKYWLETLFLFTFSHFPSERFSRLNPPTTTRLSNLFSAVLRVRKP
jgi:hypothetical protein